MNAITPERHQELKARIEPLCQQVEDPRSNAHEMPTHRVYIGKKPGNRMIKRIMGKIRKCCAQVPPVDPIGKLSDNEIQFLAQHGLGGRQVTVADLEQLDTEL